jgi:hypothetical protein
MAIKITWTESSTTYYHYSAEVTAEQADLFETDPERFFDEVDFRHDPVLEWEDIKDHDVEDYEIEEDNDDDE